MDTTATSITSRHFFSLLITKIQINLRRYNNKRSLPTLTRATLNRNNIRPNLLSSLPSQINIRIVSNTRILTSSQTGQHSTTTHQRPIGISNTNTARTRTTTRLNTIMANSVAGHPRRQRIFNSIRLVILTVRFRNGRKRTHVFNLIVKSDGLPPKSNNKFGESTRTGQLSCTSKDIYIKPIVGWVNRAGNYVIE